MAKRTQTEVSNQTKPQRGTAFKVGDWVYDRGNDESGRVIGIVADQVSYEVLENDGQIRAYTQHAHACIPAKRKPSDEIPTDRDDPRYDALYNDLTRAHHFVHEAYPEDHHVRRSFEIVFPDRDNYYPPAAEMIELKKLFDGLPPEEHRRIFNGWRRPNDPSQDRPSIVKAAGVDDVAEAMEIYSIGDRTSATLGTTITQAMRGVEICILSGTTKQQAIDELTAAVDFVRLHFEAAIAGENVDMPTSRGNYNGNRESDASKLWRSRMFEVTSAY